MIFLSGFGVDTLILESLDRGGSASGIDSGPPFKLRELMLSILRVKRTVDFSLVLTIKNALTIKENLRILTVGSTTELRTDSIFPVPSLSIG